eukprot:2779766-Pleurochrysis_carterae.AAC.1
MMRLPEAPAPGDYPLHPTVLTTVAVSSTIPSDLASHSFPCPQATVVVHCYYRLTSPQQKASPLALWTW